MLPPADTAALLRLEAVSMAAWPGLATVMEGPWAVRFGCGYTSRANSISIFQSADEPRARLERCAALLAGQGLPVIARVARWRPRPWRPLWRRRASGFPTCR